MRKYAFLTLLICLVFSCKKEKEIGEISFSTSFARLNDSVYYDSVSYLIVNYSLSSEFKNNSGFSDSSVYSHSIKYEVDKSQIQKMNYHFGTKKIKFDAGHYIIKRFDLVDKSGKVIYYIPYEVPDSYKTNIINTVIALPASFSPTEAPTDFVFTIIKK